MNNKDIVYEYDKKILKKLLFRKYSIVIYISAVITLLAGVGYLLNIFDVFETKQAAYITLAVCLISTYFFFLFLHRKTKFERNIQNVSIVIDKENNMSIVMIDLNRYGYNQFDANIINSVMFSRDKLDIYGDFSNQFVSYDDDNNKIISKQNNISKIVLPRAFSRDIEIFLLEHMNVSKE